jgi:hypothetical protein
VQSADVVFLVAAQVALRTIPALARELDRRPRRAQKDDAVGGLLRAFRCGATTFAWSAYPDQRSDLENAVADAPARTNGMTSHLSERSTAYALLLAPEPENFDKRASLVIGYALEAVPSSRNRMLEALIPDAEEIERGTDSTTMAVRRLSLGGTPDWARDNWGKLRSALSQPGRFGLSGMTSV